MIDPVRGNMYSYQKPAYKKTGDRKTDAFFEKLRRLQKFQHQKMWEGISVLRQFPTVTQCFIV